MRSGQRLALVGSLLLVSAGWAAAGEGARVSGTVRDPTGGAVAEARVWLVTAQQTIVEAARSQADGRFDFADLLAGRYLLVVRAPGFAEHRQALALEPGAALQLEITLALEPVRDQVTVTAAAGSVEDAGAVSGGVNTIGPAALRERATVVVAQAVQEEPGLHLQRTSPTVGGVFVRGLTGNKVNAFLDGARYSTAAQRGGISTFLSLLEPSSLESLEVLRGPTSAQYGSDALGGSLQFLTPPVPRGAAQGAFSVFFDSGDASLGSSLTAGVGGDTLGTLVSLAGRRANRLRPGEGRDSHSAFTRFFGLPSNLFYGDRMPDTGFTQYDGMAKVVWSPAPLTHLTAYYSRSQQDGGRRFDQLLGGDGSLVADLANLMLDFFYLRLARDRLGALDRVSLTYSFNSQREERINQGGNGDPLARINHEYERTSVHGVQLAAGKQWGLQQQLWLGAEYYRERAAAPSFGFDPAAGLAQVQRGRIPDRARYQSAGFYAQDIYEPVAGRLRLIGAVRYSLASYRARAADSPLVGGQPLWPDDSLRASDVTFRGGAVVFPGGGWSLSADVSRGFRAPHITDLGTLGLTGSGFEVAAPDLAGHGATLGTTADATAVSTGRPVTQLGPETSISYSLGAHYRHRRFESDTAVFLHDLHEAITKQALILPPGAVGQALGGQPIVAQLPNGVVFVSASPSPVLVRANFGDARLVGVEQSLRARLSEEWTLEGIATAIRARDQTTGRPPNIEGGTPAPDFWLKLRYASTGRRFWVEPYLHAATQQNRLSTLDLADRRTGATRSAAGISSFFLHGATARGLVEPGPDGVFGTADDVLRATGETLAEILLRVLGPRLESAPLFRAVPGYLTVNLRGGVRLNERHELFADLRNLADRNYRGISWGLDAPGRSLVLRFTTRF